MQISRLGATALASLGSLLSLLGGVSAPSCSGVATPIVPTCELPADGSEACPEGCLKIEATPYAPASCSGTALPITPVCDPVAAVCPDGCVSDDSTPCIGNWSAWSECSALCGGGEHSRTYFVARAASDGGAECPVGNATTEVQPCNQQRCPATCTGNATSVQPACVFSDPDANGTRTCPAGCTDTPASTPLCVFADELTVAGCPVGCVRTPVTVEEITAPTCTGVASEVSVTCTGSATPPSCDVDPGADGSDICPAGCAYDGETEPPSCAPVIPTCDLDASTDDTGSCPDGCALVEAFTPLCAFAAGISPPSGCPAGCDETPEVITMLPSATCEGTADEVQASCTGVADSVTPVCDLLCTDGSTTCTDGSNTCPVGCIYTGHTVDDLGDCDLDADNLTPEQLERKAECEALKAAEAAVDCLYAECGVALALASVVCLSVVLASCLPQGRPMIASILAAEHRLRAQTADAERLTDPVQKAEALAATEALVDKQARCKFWAWHLLFPFVCFGHSVRIFVQPCLLSYAMGAIGSFCLWIGRQCFCCLNCRCCRSSSYCICFRYQDTRFPADARSIGPIHGRAEDEIEDMYDWVPAPEICAGVDESIEIRADGSTGHSSMRLFQGEIEPEDVAQGQLGDCWLLTAIACLAEFPGAIQSVFVTQEFNPRGRYVVKLYNARSKRFEEVVIDDQIPTLEGTREPAFAKPHGRELWVTLLEKAFAKFVGSYAALDGGFTLWGLQVMTGDEVSNFALDVQIGGELLWGEYEIRTDPDEPENKLAINFYKRKRDGTHLVHTRDTFYKKLEQWDLERCVMAASTEGEDGGVETATEGLVQGHAYALMSVVEVTQIMAMGPSKKMLRLRNPWGSFEWTGPWCDGHSNWKQFPHVQKKCSEYHETLPDGSPGQAGLNDPNCDDGMFWMEYCDFMTHFTTVDVCHRSRGIADVKLNLHEDYGCVGPAQGCVEGCCSYYLPYCSKQPPHCRGCDGCTALCCPAEHKHGADYETLQDMNAGGAAGAGSSVQLPTVEMSR